MDEIVNLPFPTKKRSELGKHLGIPSKELRMMELKAIRNYNNTKKSVLTEMIKYWFDKNKSASLATIVDILEGKMGMRLDVYEDEVMKGVVSQLGSHITETDIEQIPIQLRTFLPTIVAGLVTERSTEDAREELQLYLKAWIDRKKEDATWIALIGEIKAINVEAARKIVAIRCTDKEESQEQIPAETTVIMIYIHVVMMCLTIPFLSCRSYNWIVARKQVYKDKELNKNLHLCTPKQKKQHSFHKKLP